jgi:hypothetical protein
LVRVDQRLGDEETTQMFCFAHVRQ